MMKGKYIAIEPIVSDERICDSDREVYWADEVDQRIAELEATRVPDDLLQWLFDKATYAGAWGDNYDQVEAILEKRRDNQ